MSEAGWREFVAADGLDDWAVLHGGPTAVFRTDSLRQSAALATAIAAVPGLGDRTVLTAASDRLTVKLTREMWNTESEHLALAQAVSEVARAHGARADRSAVQEVQLAISAQPDQVDLPFWRAVLGYAPLSDDNALDPLGLGSTVWMQELDPDKPLRHAMHVDVSVSGADVEARLAAAVAAGGTVVHASPRNASWILSDRSGNKVCVTAWPDGAGAAAD
jgi:4a-hydroxytetrahydrobiopterin dehydratase